MRLALIAGAIMSFLVAGYIAYVTMIANPRVVTDLKEDPMGERAERAMLLTLPDGKTIPAFMRVQTVPGGERLRGKAPRLLCSFKERFSRVRQLLSFRTRRLLTTCFPG